MEDFRTTDETARRYLFADLRKNDKLSFSDIACLLKLARHIPPSDQKVHEKNIRFTELDIDRSLESYDPKLSSISSFLLPDQEMANWANKEIAAAKSKGPLPAVFGDIAIRPTLDARGQ